MRVTIDTPAYNDRRYGRPWIGKVVAWDSTPDIEWGSWLGSPGSAGKLEIEANPGDILRHGQKDNRNPRHTENEWSIVQPDGSIVATTPAAAREQWIARASISVDDMLIQRRDALRAELERVEAELAARGEIR